MTHENNTEKERGALREDQNQLMFKEGFSFSGYERDPLYLNLGTKKFKDISGVSGIDSITDGRAGVFADFDNDGDLDVFVTTIQGDAHLLFRNNVGQNNKFLRVALEGTTSGRDAFGAVVRVKTSAGKLTKLKSGGAGFISQHDPRLLFGLGQDERVEAIEVIWPSGKVETFGGAAAGSSVLLREGSASTANSVVAVKERKASLPEPLSRNETFLRGLHLAVGQPLPELPVTTLDGKSAKLGDYLKPGRRAIINIWATWCLPCAREIPELQRLHKELAANGVDIIGVNIDTDGAADIRGYLSKRNVTYQNIIGGIPAIERIYATDELFVPISIIVDDKGMVLDLVSGWSEEAAKKFTALKGGK